MKNLIALLLLIGLAVGAYFLYQNNSSEARAQEDFKDFAIQDTASIDQIFISNLKGEKILLTRRGHKVWMVEDEFPARTDAIQLLLKTAHDIEIQSPVSKGYFPSVVKYIASDGIKVEYFQGKDKPSKVWYVGHATGSKVGTYMLLEKDGVKSSKPYITHLLMERGNLRSRFFINHTLWKDRAMVKIVPQKIRSIEVKHGEDTSTSFRIENLAEADFRITNLETGETFPVDQQIAVPYFQLYKGVYYEYIDQKTPKEIVDSVYGRTPRHEITISDKSGTTVILKTFNLPVKKGSTIEGKPITFNPERMYAYSSELGDEEHAIVQNLTFDPLVPSFERFASSTTVEK